MKKLVYIIFLIYVLFLQIHFPEDRDYFMHFVSPEATNTVTYAIVDRQVLWIIMTVTQT